LRRDSRSRRTTKCARPIDAIRPVLIICTNDRLVHPGRLGLGPPLLQTAGCGVGRGNSIP
jgi:hypothetical protein